MNMNDVRLLMGEVLDEFRNLRTITIKNNTDDKDMALRVLKLHYHNAIGNLEGIKRTYCKIVAKTVDDVDKCFDIYELSLKSLDYLYVNARDYLR